MNFQKIEIFGFKSFADRLQVQFEPGITAIVGPNGCGKSNVADSIRWVLGEQSAKTLRGSNMQDVIFSGTQNRKSLSYCEVSLFFDNTTRIFDLEFNEVSITRKLYRSGESEYAINKKPCRLKDIIDLLRQTGLGKGGYSIIGQGRIDEILSSKPGDRRGIFEEATGISKFKAKKIETERKLARTKENLVRINDIIGELERQIGPLKKQSEDARKCLELRTQLEYYEVNNYIYQYESASEGKAKIQQHLDGIAEEYEQVEKQAQLAGENYENCLSRITNADNDVEKLHNELIEITLKLEKKTGEANVNRERMQLFEEQNRRLEEEIHVGSVKYSEVSSELERKMQSRISKLSEIEELGNSYRTVQDQHFAVVGEIAKHENENEISQAEVVESINKLSEIKANLSGLLAEKKTLETRRDIIVEKMRSILGQIEQANVEKSNVDELKDSATHQLEGMQDSLRQSIERRNELSLDLESHHKLVNNLKSEYASVETKYKLYMVMRDNMDGYQHSVRTLLQKAQEDREIKRRIEGVVARLVKVPAKYETAIEIALGGAMQNVVTKTREDAKYLINYLKSTKSGRATFLPIDGVKPRYLDDFERQALKTIGCLGVACDLIEYDKKYENVYRSLLGKTLIVDNLDTAIKISKMRDVTYKIVSLEGDVIAPGGSMTGGSRNTASASTLGYDREIRESKEKLDFLRDDIESAKNLRDKAVSEVSRAQESVANLEKAIHNKDLDILSLQERYAKIDMRAREQQGVYDEFEIEISTIDDRLNFINSSQVEIDRLENILREQKNSASSEVKQIHANYDRLKIERDELSEKVTALKVKIAEGNSFVTAISDEIKRLNSELLSIDESISKATNNIRVNSEIIEECRKVIETATNLVTGDERAREIREKLSNLGTYKADLNAELARSDKLKTDLSQQLNEITAKKIKVEFELEKMDTDMQAMQVRIAEEYELNYESALPRKDENFEVGTAPKEIAKLRRQIQSLGFVNMAAIDTYREVGERYEDMSAQRNDLVAAESDLLKIIDELTGEMLTRFNEGFKTINNNFTAIFKELFGGGNAQLVIEPSEDGNQLDDGIEIVAEPPGKKLQSITLLSGGERALTAIAILFAILRLRPMPFCVLDEIEAALDDANVDRFARYLHKFSKQTQFIVITHRKPTMELADALYGVTMEEKGVSKIVSIKLSDALERFESQPA